jgi:hypothetical protein
VVGSKEEDREGGWIWVKEEDREGGWIWVVESRGRGNGEVWLG